MYQRLLRTFVEFLEMEVIPVSGNTRLVIFIAGQQSKAQQRGVWPDMQGKCW